jgi:Tol biopolymer transport system component
MEYLEGETLAARLARGPLPFPQVVRHAVEISDALDTAHRRGVLHRDLKPSNIAFTSAGAKLLDFGLARRIAPAAAGGRSAVTRSAAADLTQPGTVLGTLQYMAPEQVRGEEADARTDIFAFGAVLYQMVTGANPFYATSSAGLIAAILEHEPPAMTEVQPSTPAALERIVRVCLAKDPADRWQNARDVTLQLLDLAAAPVEGATHAASDRRGRIVPTLALAAVLSAAAFAPLAYYRTASRGEAADFDFAITPPENSVSRVPLDPFTAVSPDGRHVAFTVQTPGDRGQLWVRSLDAPDARMLPGTDQAFIPFWRPDSAEIGFFSLDGQLKAVSPGGGPVRVLCNVADPLGGTWNQDGVILFSTAATSVSTQTSVPVAGLHRISAAGGVPTPVRIAHDPAPAPSRQLARRYGALEGWPEFLPDGRSFLFLERGSMTIHAGTFDSDKTTPLLQSDSQAAYAQGHLLFVREGTLMGQRFDAERLELSGEPFRVAENVRFDVLLGGAVFSASDDGVLAYSEGQAAVGATRHTWLDSTGQPAGAVNLPPGVLRLSPDGTRIAQARLMPGSVSHIWITDLLRKGSPSRPLTTGAGAETYPVWSPDGADLVYASNENGVFDLYRIASSGSGKPEALYRSGHDKIPTDWSADGRLLAFTDRNPTTRSDVLLLDLKQGGAPIAGVATPAAEDQARFSNDGKWLAYRSNESGRPEIYVKPLPVGDPISVSSDGGTAPLWRQDSRRLFFASLDGRVMAADIAPGASFRDSAVTPVFALPSILCGTCGMAVTTEGSFIISSADSPPERPMRIRTNWLSGLARSAR